jgi:hypothetical protein
MSSKNFAVKHGLTVGDNEIITASGDINFVSALKINGDSGLSGQILQTTGTGLAWAPAPEAGGSSVSVSETAPNNPESGDLWIDSNTGILYAFTTLDEEEDGSWIQPTVGYYNSGSTSASQLDYGLVTEDITSTQDYGTI